MLPSIKGFIEFSVNAFINISLLNFNLKCVCFKQYASNPSMVLSKMSAILEHVLSSSVC